MPKHRPLRQAGSFGDQRDSRPEVAILVHRQQRVDHCVATALAAQASPVDGGLARVDGFVWNDGHSGNGRGADPQCQRLLTV